MKAQKEKLFEVDVYHYIPDVSLLLDRFNRSFYLKLSNVKIKIFSKNVLKLLKS